MTNIAVHNQKLLFI